MLDRDYDIRCYGDVTVVEATVMMTMMMMMMMMVMMKCDNDYYN